MGSSALAVWEDERAKRIDELMEAHRTVGGSDRGRRWKTQQLNWSMILRLASELQGYARDLHDLAVAEFVNGLASGFPAAESAIGTQLSNKRLLDSGNAQPGSLGNDFARFGLQLWPALRAHDSRAAGWNTDLEALNKARNAIAHDDVLKLQELKVDGYNLNNLTTFRAFRRSMNFLVPALDTVVADHLAAVYRKGKPW
ncbi:MAG: hypothetical protein JHC70_21115 [Rhodococcus sp.]|nr:hypothetical protein [Rhodococcus sp. (in: high G+C Gram-positive bacteria)]MBJ7324826.1 hypothetical protein [Rhodococcus sp. (in: high G+C Gram-positive bacteria)]